MTDRIAILGWGSLIWDANADFDLTHEPWADDGPILPLEFSRVSESRGGALTLVIDTLHGAKCQTAYSISIRDDVQEAVLDLQHREQTSAKRIGWLTDSAESNCRNMTILNTVAVWLKEKRLGAVIWTDLPSNFAERAGRCFSVEAGMDYINGLDSTGHAKAIRYIENAPRFVKTPLRCALSKR